MANTKQQILQFRRELRTLAQNLARKQGMYAAAGSTAALAEPDEGGLDPAQRHTCDKAANRAWRKPGPCAECQYEQNVRARLTALLGPPIQASDGSAPETGPQK